ncbi:MAG: hypothetical protein CSA32_05220 [Desulfobulbus propionicus]|nr:MAG: hypothetical protein CSA32_05220 [Desulfobulbus propionicus]
MTSGMSKPSNSKDILITRDQEKPFSQKVTALGLSAELERKCLAADRSLHAEDIRCPQFYLTVDDEKELATEVLLCRHRFTNLVSRYQPFRQAALSVIQNIYLSRERRIFFDRGELSTEQERQAALLLLGSPGKSGDIPLCKTFQHHVLARIWYRVLFKMETKRHHNLFFRELQTTVEQLNSLRNIYILLTTGLVNKLTARISTLYQQSITPDDARQIGSFGIARAAYRYHHSTGQRFSTFASYWIRREVQQQALHARLIRIPTSLIEQLSKAARQRQPEKEQQLARLLHRATTLLGVECDGRQKAAEDPAEQVERREMHRTLSAAIDSVLPDKSADVVKRRYGLGAYKGREQSAVEVARVYGVTRGSIYQLEQAAISRLKKHLLAMGF